MIDSIGLYLSINLPEIILVISGVLQGIMNFITSNNYELQKIIKQLITERS